jgi:hypothetical protein
MKKLSRGYRIISPGLLLTFTFFFLPWVLTSCGSEPLQEYSGWELAVGTAAKDGYNGNLMVMLSLAAIVLIVIFMISFLRRQRLAFGDSYGVLITSVAVLLLMFQQFLTPPAEGVNREILYGFWGFLVGWIIILIGGVVNLVDRPSINDA